MSPVQSEESPIGAVRSSRFTRERSQVRNPPRPLREALHLGFFLLTKGALPSPGWRLAAFAQELVAREVRGQVRSPREGQAGALPARPRLRRHGASVEGSQGVRGLEGSV